MSFAPARRARRSAWPAVAAAILAASAGCGEEALPGVGVPTYPVSGKVLKADGSPLPGGIVTFVPGDAKTPKASGPIAPDGRFTLNTDGVAAGAPAGDFRVRIELDPEGSSTARRGLPFPARYAKESTSDLTATVKADATNDYTFKLQ